MFYAMVEMTPTCPNFFNFSCELVPTMTRQDFLDGRTVTVTVTEQLLELTSTLYNSDVEQWLNLIQPDLSAHFSNLHVNWG